MNIKAVSAYCRDTAKAASLPVSISGNRFCGGDAAIRHPGGNWLKNNCKACFDRAWLDYQRESASRHKPAIKTIKVVAAAADHLPLRYMIAKIYHIAAPIKPFLSREGRCANEAETLRQAWSKAIFWPMALRGGPQGTCDFN